MRWVALGTLASLSVWAQPTSAQDSDRAAPTIRKSRPLELAAGADLLFATQSVCRTDGDLVGCSAPSFRGGYAAPQWRFAPRWSTGLFGALLVSPETDTASYSMWQALAETRLHPWGPGSIDPWAGLLLGLTAATDTLQSEPPKGDRSVTAYAPTAGLHAGADFGLSSDFSLQVAARGFVSAYRDPRALGETTSRDYGTSTWVSLHLGLMVHPPLGKANRAGASRWGRTAH